jgi:uncharacterized hydantoinase/oxoprolinase family protein
VKYDAKRFGNLRSISKIYAALSIVLEYINEERYTSKIGDGCKRCARIDAIICIENSYLSEQSLYADE